MAKALPSFSTGFFLVNIWIAISQTILHQFYVLMGLMEGSQQVKSYNSNDRYGQKEQSKNNKQTQDFKKQKSNSIRQTPQTPQTPGIKVHNYAPGAPLKAKRVSRLMNFDEDEEDELEYRLTGYRRGETERESQTPFASPLRPEKS